MSELFTPHFAIMESQSLVLLGLVFALVSISCILSSKRRREVVLDRLRLRRRRTSGASTPPRSLSPKKDKDESTDPDYTNVFPPSRRFTLAEVAPEIVAKYTQLPARLGQQGQQALEAEPIPIPLEVPFDEADPKALTPTDFSVEEIKALGDFPDYATLSGVPLPVPYENFNLETALPRPYRPFRWAYHQTMCTSHLPHPSKFVPC